MPRDILPWFLGAGIFNETEKTRILSRQTDQQGELESRLAELRALWREADELGLPFAPQVDGVLAEVDQRLDDTAWLQREMPLIRTLAPSLRGFPAAGHRRGGVPPPGRMREFAAKVADALDGRTLAFLGRAEMAPTVAFLTEAAELRDWLGKLPARPALTVILLACADAPAASALTFLALSCARERMAPPAGDYAAVSHAALSPPPSWAAVSNSKSRC